jgi:urease accessory protein UreF
MLDQTYNVPQTASEILGDLTALAAQLGSAEGLCPLGVAASSLGSAQVRTVPEFQQFLADYTAGLLIPVELGAVVRAFKYCSQFQVRELIALDHELGRVPALQSFAAASGRVGRTQLRRLRPLRDERIVQRYGNAVEANEAKGWHTVVFGLVLATYSLPLRQGLSHFAHRTLAGFIEAASHQLPMAVQDRPDLLSTLAGPISTGIASVIGEHMPTTACFGEIRD